MEIPYGLNLWTGLESPILYSIGQAVTKSRFKKREHRPHYQWDGHKKSGDASNFQFDLVINKHLLTNTLRSSRVVLILYQQIYYEIYCWDILKSNRDVVPIN